MIKDRGVWVYDIETLASFFSFYGINIDTEEEVVFIIHRSKNDYKELIEFLNTNKGGIGFNNVNFDYPIIHYMIKEYKNFVNLDKMFLNFPSICCQFPLTPGLVQMSSLEFTPQTLPSAPTEIFFNFPPICTQFPWRPSLV